MAFALSKNMRPANVSAEWVEALNLNFLSAVRLASPRGEWITGHNHYVDGGWAELKG